MAFASVRNLASYNDAVSYANFKVSTDKWEYHKLLPKGSKWFLDTVYEVNGAHFKHVPPAYILNVDCTSQYYFIGIQKMIFTITDELA